jgi:hypothetical protein
VAFCPHCGAPQIRVSTASAPEPAVAPAFPPGTTGEVQPPAQRVGPVAVRLEAIEWPQALRAGALAGLLLAFAIFFVPMIVAGIGLFLHLGQGAIGLLVLLTSWCCILVAGALAVRFYRRRRPDVSISTGMGVRLGAVSGLLGFFFYSVPQALRLAFFHLSGSVREAMQKAIEQSAAQSPDPRAQEMMRNLMSPGVLAAFITVLVVLFFLSFLVLSSLGGAIAASVSKSKHFE